MCLRYHLGFHFSFNGAASSHKLVAQSWKNTSCVRGLSSTAAKKSEPFTIYDSWKPWNAIHSSSSSSLSLSLSLSFSFLIRLHLILSSLFGFVMAHFAVRVLIVLIIIFYWHKFCVDNLIISFFFPAIEIKNIKFWLKMIHRRLKRRVRTLNALILYSII